MPNTGPITAGLQFAAGCKEDATPVPGYRSSEVERG